MITFFFTFAQSFFELSRMISVCSCFKSKNNGKN